jgi:hypothetical protein
MTFRSPYEGLNGAEVLAAAVSAQRPSPRSKGVDVGPFEDVLLRALSLRPADRYTNAHDLLVALDAAAKQMPPDVVTTVPEVVRQVGDVVPPPMFAVGAPVSAILVEPSAVQPLNAPLTLSNVVPRTPTTARPLVEKSPAIRDERRLKQQLLLVAVVPLLFGLALFALRRSPNLGASSIDREGRYDAGYMNQLPNLAAQPPPMRTIDPTWRPVGRLEASDASDAHTIHRPDAALAPARLIAQRLANDAGQTSGADGSTGALSH